MKPTTSTELIPAATFDVNQLTTEPTVAAQLAQLHSLVLGVCPDCLAKRRDDDGVIYVPRERKDAKSNKNLLTLWAQASSVRMRIMPEAEEIYAPNAFATYRSRLAQLLEELRQRAN